MFEFVIRALITTSKDSSDSYPAEAVPKRIPVGVMMASARHEPRQLRVEVLYTDRAWRLVEVLAWARWRAGWAALVRWPDASEDWRVYNGQHIRPL